MQAKKKSAKVLPKHIYILVFFFLELSLQTWKYMEKTWIFDIWPCCDAFCLLRLHLLRHLASRPGGSYSNMVVFNVEFQHHISKNHKSKHVFILQRATFFRWRSQTMFTSGYTANPWVNSWGQNFHEKSFFGVNIRSIFWVNFYEHLWWVF